VGRKVARDWPTAPNASIAQQQPRGDTRDKTPMPPRAGAPCCVNAGAGSKRPQLRKTRQPAPLCPRRCAKVAAMTMPPIDDLMAGRAALRRELAGVPRPRDEILAALRELQAEVRALRIQAEERTAVLNRLREIEQARAVERDPGQRMN